MGALYSPSGHGSRDVSDSENLSRQLPSGGGRRRSRLEPRLHGARLCCGPQRQHAAISAPRRAGMPRSRNVGVAGPGAGAVGRGEDDVPGSRCYGPERFAGRELAYAGSRLSWSDEPGPSGSFC